jgi:ATP-dependent DNA helicase RecG
MTARYGTVLTSPRRREVLEVPYDALREAVINAVAHRDYFEKGANVMVEMG